MCIVAVLSAMAFPATADCDHDHADHGACPQIHTCNCGSITGVRSMEAELPAPPHLTAPMPIGEEAYTGISVALVPFQPPRA